MDTNPAGDPLHRPSSSGVSWTTGNVREAIPGVQTPLSYTFWAAAFERTVRGSYGELGVLSRAQAKLVPQTIEQTALGVFYGRPVLNVNLVLEVGAALPGVSSREVANSILGEVELAYLPPNRPTRYPIVLVKFPLLASRLGRRMSRLRQRIDHTWQRVTERPMDPAAARAALPELLELFTAALLNHSHATFLSSACHERLAELADPDQLSGLLSGAGGLIEVAMLQQLWEVANGRRTIDEFISRHGYLGPYAGNLRSRSWRDDPQPLRRVCTTYRAVAEQDAPGCAEARQRARHTAATGLLLGSLPAYRRPAARALVRAAAHFIPLREVGKNSYLQAADATRAVLRALGAALAGQGVLQDADDVWFLTWTELRDGLPADLTGELVRRRKRFEEYLQLDIPPFCTGTPEPVTGAEADLTSGGVLQGIGASHGVVEGFARVIADPTADVEPLEPGEILVAAATDPSWTTLFVGAAAVVIDVGGNLSHGAIVARELGIPCVTNVRTATSRINSGDRLVVDGAQGTVTRVTDFGQE